MSIWRRWQVRGALTFALAAGLGGCAEMSEMFSYGDEEERAEARAEAEFAHLSEMSIMAGRYGVMLGQAREILNLPEPRESMSFPTDAQDQAKQREDLARYQASVTAEFLSDAARACSRKRVPRHVRQIACEQRAKVPAELMAPVQPEIQALAVRNDRVGEFIMPWWDAVCALAPKPREGDARMRDGMSARPAAYFFFESERVTEQQIARMAPVICAKFPKT